MVLLWIGPWLARPLKIQENVLATEREQKALRATDWLVNDLKQVIPGSLPVEPKEPGADSTLELQRASDARPAGEPPWPAVTVRYSLPGGMAGKGISLYRVVDGSSTLIASDLLAPDPAEPWWRLDPKLKLVIITLRFQSPDGRPLRVVRHVALPN